MVPVGEVLRTALSEPAGGAQHSALRASRRCSVQRSQSQPEVLATTRRRHTEDRRRPTCSAQRVLTRRCSAQRVLTQRCSGDRVLERARSGDQRQSEAIRGNQGIAYWSARVESHLTSWLLFVPGWLKSCTAAAKRPAKVWRGESAQPDALSVGEAARLDASAPSWAPSEEPSRGSRGGEIALAPSFEMAPPS